MQRFNCETEIRAMIVNSGAAFFRSWKRRHGRRVTLRLAPSRDGTVWQLVATVPHARLGHGTADMELAVLAEDYRPESFNGQATEAAARRAVRRADGYNAESDPATVEAGAARLARVHPSMLAAV